MRIDRLPSRESPAAQMMVAAQQDGPEDRTSEAQSKATLQAATSLRPTLEHFDSWMR